MLISAKGMRAPGTCEWITQNESYQSWLYGDAGDNMNGGTRLLWISGGPGKGKSMMALYLTEELEKHTETLAETDLTFFFCSAQDEKRNTAVAVLRGLVRQIVIKRPQLAKYALPYLETPEMKQQTLSSLEALWIVFSKMVADTELGTMFCVLDGLDECEASAVRVLLPKIRALLAGQSVLASSGIFKLVIVSRDIHELRGCTRVRLDPDNDEKVASDIERFVSAKVKELSKIEGFDAEFQSYIQTALLKRAEGTFLWVGFAMDELSQKHTRSEILEALEDLPSGLPAIYGRMLLQIPVKRREMSLSILRWVTMAARPLELHELAAAAGVQSLSDQMTTEQKIRDIITDCGPLLRVQENDCIIGHSSKQERHIHEVSLIHQSARDYLLRTSRDNDAVLESFRLDVEVSHLELARICLDCISQSGLQHSTLDLSSWTELGPQEPSLLRYAVFYWHDHAKGSSELAAELFDRSALFFQEESTLRYHWWAAYDKETNRYHRNSLSTSLLRIAFKLNIKPWIEAILAEKSWGGLRQHKRVDEIDDLGNTALFWAVEEGNSGAAQLLLDRGAECTLNASKNSSGFPVLHMAIQHWKGKESEAMVRLLLDRGVDVNEKTKSVYTVEHTALHLAATRGLIAALQLLIDAGANIRAKNVRKETVLHSALLGPDLEKREPMVRLLVNRGAEINEKDRMGRTALQLAISSHDIDESEAIVKFLVDRGADINAKDNGGITAIQLAVSAKIAQTLVDGGADVNSKNLFGTTALHWAVEREDEATVQLLLDRGADINAKTIEGKSALQRSFGNSNSKITQLLMDRGAEAEIRVGDTYNISLFLWIFCILMAII